MPVLLYCEKRVVTTDMLAQVCGTGESTIQDNVRKNLDRFVEGKHYYKLEGEHLREFKKALTGIFPVSANTRHLMLWTERGAARHAKMLEVAQMDESFGFRKGGVGKS